MCVCATGSQWIGVPGELRGYEALHRRYGRVSWAKLFEPTIGLARNGIEMPPFLAEVLKEPRMKLIVEKSSLWYQKKMGQTAIINACSTWFHSKVM